MITTVDVELPVWVTPQGIFFRGKDNKVGPKLDYVLSREELLGLVDAMRFKCEALAPLVQPPTDEITGLGWGVRAFPSEIETTLVVDGNVTPGDPGVRTYSNGDPGYPPTGPDVELEFAGMTRDLAPWEKPSEFPNHTPVVKGVAQVNLVEELTDTLLDQCSDELADFADAERSEPPCNCGDSCRC